MDNWVVATYWICLLVGILYTVASFFLGGIAHIAHIGDFGHVHGDFSHDYGVDGAGHGEASGSDAGGGGEILFSPFSPLVVAFFLTCFGAAGVIFTHAWHNGSVLSSLLFSLAAAIALAWAFIALGNRILGGMQIGSEVKLHTLIGMEAEVTVAIAPTGVGEIAYIAMGSRNVAPARSDSPTTIPRSSIVRIERITGNIFYVTPVAAEDGSDALESPAASHPA